METCGYVLGGLEKLASDSNANFDRTVIIDGSEIEPQVTWGTSPEMVAPVSGSIPDPDFRNRPNKEGNLEQALKYMGLEAGTEIKNIQLDYIFIGSHKLEDRRPQRGCSSG